MRPPAPALFELVHHRASRLTQTLINLALGFGLTVLVQLCALPLLGMTTTAASKSLVAALFAALSTLQSSIVLRIFIGIEKAEERERRARARRLERLLWTGRI